MTVIRLIKSTSLALKCSIVLILAIMGLVVYYLLSNYYIAPKEKVGYYDELKGGISFEYNPGIWRITKRDFSYTTGNIGGVSWESSAFQSPMPGIDAQNIIEVSSAKSVISIVRQTYGYNYDSFCLDSLDFKNIGGGWIRYYRPDNYSFVYIPQYHIISNKELNCNLTVKGSDHEKFQIIAKIERTDENNELELVDAMINTIRRK